MKVSWAATAKRELRSGLKYIRQRNRQAADRIAIQVRMAVARLAHFPESGSLGDELPAGFRFIIVEPFVLYYLIRSNEIIVVRVRHGSQDTPTSFED